MEPHIMINIITKDPDECVPNVKENDFLVIHLYSKGYNYLCVTKYNHRRVSVIGYKYHDISTLTFDDFGWERPTLLKMLQDTYQQWKYYVRNDIVEYYVINNIRDLEDVISHLSMPNQIADFMTNEYKEYLKVMKKEMVR